MRKVLFAALTLSLGGCNMVVSDTPWFDARDEVGGPSLREGVWDSPSADCKFKESEPAGQWPKCASGAIIHDHHIVFLDPSNVEKTRASFILTSSHPQVWQMELTLGAQASPLLKIPGFLYLGAKPLSVDASGRITAVQGWIVQCGPVAKDVAAPVGTGKDSSSLANLATHAPFAGLKMNENGACTAESKDAVVNAARLSEALRSESDNPLRWVRDGDQ